MNMFDNDDNLIRKCPECGTRFENAFEVIDHMMEDDEEFDPALILPGGYRLMIGSLLRSVYDNSHDSNLIRDIAQSTYVTLFAAEYNPEVVGENIEDLIVESAMENLDGELNKLFKDRE